MIYFYTSENVRKTEGFLTFSGVIKLEHRAKMG